MRVKQSAIQARQDIAAISAEEPTELDLDQMEEVLKGNFKTLKDYVSALREFRQARPGAEEALAILDEALQVNLSISATSKLQSNTLIEIDAPSSATEASVCQFLQPLLSLLVPPELSFISTKFRGMEHQAAPPPLFAVLFV